jgi:hypothetical protein
MNIFGDTMTMVEEYMRDAIINSIIHDEAFMYFLMLLVAVLIFTVYITIEEEKLN